MIRPVTGVVPHAVSKLWAFFVLGILVTTLAFVVASWHSLESTTRQRLAILAAAVARVEDSYLHGVAGELRRLRARLAPLSPPARERLLRHYLRIHPQNREALVLDARDRVLVSAGAHIAQGAGPAIPSLTRLCLIDHHLCLSPPVVTGNGRFVLFARPLSAHETLVLERALGRWPRLRGLIAHLPPHLHIFVVNHTGALEYRLPDTHVDYRAKRSGALMRTLRSHDKPDGTFSGKTIGGFRLGAYHTARDGLVVGVSLPLKDLILTFAHRLEIPLLLIFLLIASATLYYRHSRLEIAEAEARQEEADARVHAERAFAEQQRDFYLAVSELNQFIVRHPEPEALFAETCRIIIAYTGLLFAWIGRIEIGGRIRVVAVSEKRPLGIDWKRELFTTDPTRPEGQGPAGRAARSNHIEISDDLAHDSAFDPWRSMHAQAGTRSASALPIRTKGGVIAILALGSEQPQLFSPPLVRLLEGLVRDLAFSLEDTEREQQLAYQARHDALTGLYNRTFFHQALNEAVEHAGTEARLAIAIFDLDGFKGINDQFGHAVGDELLRRVAQRLLAALPPTATLARLGGDEFGALLAPIGGRDQAMRQVEAARWALDTPFHVTGHDQLTIAISIGVSLLPEDGRQTDDLIRRADLALYEAKRLGKNVYRFFTPALEERLINRHRLQRDFANALRERALLLHFQPQVELATGRLRSLEALLRWPNADGTLRQPNAYFPAIIHNADLMRQLDLFVLEQAFVATRRFLTQGLSIPIAVNIHGPHLLHPDFLRDLRAIA